MGFCFETDIVREKPPVFIDEIVEVILKKHIFGFHFLKAKTQNYDHKNATTD